MLKHSKLPWDIHFDTQENWCLVADNFTVAQDNTVDTQSNPKMSKANGQFIKKACNNYYELVKTLEYFYNISFDLESSKDKGYIKQAQEMSRKVLNRAKR
jgi:hypothetical protein